MSNDRSTIGVRADPDSDDGAAAGSSRAQAQGEPEDPELAYERLVGEATGRRPSPRIEAAVALVVVIASVWVLVALQRGVQLRQLLIGGLVVVCVNAVAAIIWQTLVARRSR